MEPKNLQSVAAVETPSPDAAAAAAKQAETKRKLSEAGKRGQAALKARAQGTPASPPATTPASAEPTPAPEAEPLGFFATVTKALRGHWGLE